MEPATWTGVRRACGKRSHTLCWQENPTEKNLFTTELYGSNGPSPELPLPLNKKRGFPLLLLCACGSPRLHVLDCNPFFSSICPFWWWNTWLALVYIWYMLCVVCLRLLLPPLLPITEIQSLATSLVDVISYFFLASYFLTVFIEI